MVLTSHNELPRTLVDLARNNHFTRQTWTLFLQTLRPDSAVKCVDMCRVCHTTSHDGWAKKQYCGIIVLYGVKLVNNQYEFFIRLIDANARTIFEEQLVKDMKFLLSSEIYFQFSGKRAVYCLEFRNKKLCMDFKQKFSKILKRPAIAVIAPIKIMSEVTYANTDFLNNIGVNSPQIANNFSFSGAQSKESESLSRFTGSQDDASQSDTVNHSNKKNKNQPKAKKVPKAPVNPPPKSPLKPQDKPAAPNNFLADIRKGATVPCADKPSSAPQTKPSPATIQSPPQNRPPALMNVLADIRKGGAAAPQAKLASPPVAKPSPASKTSPPQTKPPAPNNFLADIRNNFLRPSPDKVSSTPMAKPSPPTGNSPPPNRPPALMNVLADIRKGANAPSQAKPASPPQAKPSPAVTQSNAGKNTSLLSNLLGDFKVQDNTNSHASQASKSIENIDHGKSKPAKGQSKKPDKKNKKPKESTAKENVSSGSKKSPPGNKATPKISKHSGDKVKTKSHHEDGASSKTQPKQPEKAPEPAMPKNPLLLQIQKGTTLASVKNDPVAAEPEKKDDFYSRFKNAIEERNAAGGLDTQESDSEPDSDW